MRKLGFDVVANKNKSHYGFLFPINFGGTKASIKVTVAKPSHNGVKRPYLLRVINAIDEVWEYLTNNQ